MEQAQQVQEVEVTKYKLRGLQMQDIFPLSKVLKKMELKITVPENATKEEIGLTIVMNALENLHQAEDEVSELLASLVGISPAEFKKLPITEAINIFNQFTELPGLSTFFKQAMK